MSRKQLTCAPAAAMTVVSMALTLAVVIGWLGALMPWPVATVVGLGMDGGWLATLAYERRLAAQGDHSGVVSGLGWTFALLATAVLVAHALVGPSPAGWLAVAWLPLAAKALWLVHGLWERTALTPTALEEIRTIRQTARDDAAVSRARLSAQAGAEETRLAAVTAAGVRVARVQARTAHTLAAAWKALAVARDGEDTGRALTCVTSRVTPGVTPRWELPTWGPDTTAGTPRDTSTVLGDTPLSPAVSLGDTPVSPLRPELVPVEASAQVGPEGHPTVPGVPLAA
ncbi:hypothetical protein, partial [Candidatus Frankia alpina]|uniref:hypothetical protein n=1 Tax=Candidatus Frankia alpina TaxID=2699483 RepID=UPI001A98689B